MTFQIVILALIAAFLGLRLYSVLGRRAEHEEEPIQGRFDEKTGVSGLPVDQASWPVDPSRTEMQRYQRSNSACVTSWRLTAGLTRSPSSKGRAAHIA